MKILALASVSHGTMNLPKDVKERLKLTEKGKLLFVLDDNGRIYVEKA